jgi:hypothetical protein
LFDQINFKILRFFRRKKILYKRSFIINVIFNFILYQIELIFSNWIISSWLSIIIWFFMKFDNLPHIKNHKAEAFNSSYRFCVKKIKLYNFWERWSIPNNLLNNIKENIKIITPFWPQHFCHPYGQADTVLQTRWDC